MINFYKKFLHMLCYTTFIGEPHGKHLKNFT